MPARSWLHPWRTFPLRHLLLSLLLLLLLRLPLHLLPLFQRQKKIPS